MSATITIDIPGLVEALEANTRATRDLQLLLAAMAQASPAITAPAAAWPPPSSAPNAEPAEVRRGRKPAIRSAVIRPFVNTTIMTEERQDLLARTWVAGDLLDKIWQALNALPGPEIKWHLVAAYASKMKLRRPAKFMTELYKGVPIDERRPAAAPPVGDDQPEAPSLDEAFDLPAVVPVAPVVSPPPPPAPAPPPAPRATARPAASAVPSPIIIWSPARIAKLVAAYGRCANDDLLAELSLLPGPLVRMKDMLVRATALGLSKAATSPTTPIVTDLATIISWAAVRGVQVTSSADLLKVNAKAHSLGLRPFEIEGRGPRRS